MLRGKWRKTNFLSRGLRFLVLQQYGPESWVVDNVKLYT